MQKIEFNTLLHYGVLFKFLPDQPRTAVLKAAIEKYCVKDYVVVMKMVNSIDERKSIIW